MTPEKKKSKEMFYAMLRIRRVQERIDALYLEDDMKTPVHLCIGQEAIAVGVCAALEKSDYISSNHRSHGHYLAKGGDLKKMVAELHCRETGCSKGFGGSMHLVDVSVGHLGSSSIVGGGIPIGTGVGLSIKMKEDHKVSVVFFGDGAADEGVLYESVNFAMLKKLPVVYVLENNQWSVCSHVSSRQAGNNVFHQADQNLLMTATIDGNDVLGVHKTAVSACERAVKGFGPSFIECKTYRIPGHAGCEAQDPEGYRAKSEVDGWRLKCPVGRFRDDLIEKKILTAEDLSNMEKKIADEIDDAFLFARKSPLACGDNLGENLFCG